jgi:hypothetical protein
LIAALGVLALTSIELVSVMLTLKTLSLGMDASVVQALN